MTLMSNKPKDLLNLTSLRLTAPPQQGAKYPASFSVGVWENKPQFTIRLGIENLKNSGLFSVTLYPVEFYMVLASIKKIAAEPFTEGSEAIKRRMVVSDKPGNDGRVTGTIAYGRDEKGRMYILLVNPDTSHPKVIFYLTPPRRFDVQGGTEQETSAMYATAYADFWQSFISGYLEKNYSDNSGFNNNGGGNNYNNNNNGGGYNNNGGGSNNNGGNHQQESDDDIPF